MYMFNNTNETKNLVITNKSPLEPKQKPNRNIKENKIKIMKAADKNIVAEDADLEAKDKGPIKLEAKILNYQSPSLLYLSLIDQQKAFNELYENIQKYYTKNITESKDDWKVEDRCCTICNQSQTWRRATILEIKGDTAKVFYTDFACVENILISALRPIPEEFLLIGDAAVMCHLCGVIPAVGEEWPLVTKEYLQELLDAYPRVFITKHGNFKGKSMPIELWVYHTIQGGALEPNHSEWRCLNKKIIEQGLGIPEKFEEPSDTTENSDDIASVFNLVGSIQDYLQLELQPLKPLKIKSDSEDTNSRSNTPTEDYSDNTGKDRRSSNTVFISDWLPPEPLPLTEFTACPTYIDNDGLVYLHEVSQRETLDLIRKALDVRFKDPDPKAKFTKWNVGEPCIALYFLDSKFYRGRVLEVHNDTATCLIHYIDYGNEEMCTFANLRKSIALYQIPVQAHKCVLNRIRPHGNQWDRQTLDYIHKSVVEKECFVKITGEAVGDVLPIELKYNKLWINDHLVEFEMAIYTDGSKAVVQKFAPDLRKETKEIDYESDYESDSGPDFIVNQEDNITFNNESFEMESLQGRDWNELLEEDEKRLSGNFVTFPMFTDKEFVCDITVINEISILELSITHDEDTAALYKCMYKEIQAVDAMSPLKGVFENKACIALFPEDQKWYRATILQYSASKNKVKVKYIDYGNIEIISLAEIREIGEEYTQLPPATITAVLDGVKINDTIDVKVMFESLSDVFLDKGPFQAKIINDKHLIPSVELRDLDGNLVYKSLIDCGFLIQS